MTLTSREFPDNILEFHIYIEHTNAPTIFEYAGGQFFFSFNRNVLSPGPFPPHSGEDTANYGYQILEDSDLPQTMRPRGPSFGTATNPIADIMRIAVNSFPGAGILSGLILFILKS